MDIGLYSLFNFVIFFFSIFRKYLYLLIVIKVLVLIIVNEMIDFL